MQRNLVISNFNAIVIRKYSKYVLLVVLVALSVATYAQLPGRLGNLRGMGGGGGGRSDTIGFEKRDPMADSLTIRFRYLDSIPYYSMDSSLTDFYERVPNKPTYSWLGNNGNASQSLIFSPNTTPGWEPGFNAFNPFAFTVLNTRFFHTTRPYTELNYIIAGFSEQFINVLHTQNIKPNWNFAFQFRLTSAPGEFKSQAANHSNLRFNTNYQSPNKRYALYLIGIRNSLQSAENGGLQNINHLREKSGLYGNRLSIPINTSDNVAYSNNPFSTRLNTGNRYGQFKFLLRQQYDFGKKDSIVTDSSVIKLFYPRFRIQHTAQYNSYDHLFQDIAPTPEFYLNNYNIVINPQQRDTFRFANNWKEVVNDFSIYQFPDIKNQQQFLKVGAALQNLSLTWPDSTQATKPGDTYYNIFLNGEYRNRTRNGKWNMAAYGQLYMAGLNAGDYRAFVSLEREIGSKIGSLQVGFENANRTPSYKLFRNSGFPVTIAEGLNKENITHLFTTIKVPRLLMVLQGHYYLYTNYTYLRNFHEVAQQSSPFNMLQITASKKFNLNRLFKWYTDVTVQQTAGSTPLNVPLIFMRNRIALEGNFFKNLFLATGIDSRYYSAYTPDNYSPVLGQFFPQNEVRISNLPDISYFLNFRIRSFTCFTRIDNLNTIDFSDFSFTNNNVAAPLYPYTGMQFKIGIFWGFVN